MKLEQISLPVNNKLLVDYWSEEAPIHQFFDYQYNDEAFKERAKYLQNKAYDAKELTAVVRGYMTKFGITARAQEHLQELEAGALAVVGGQQAGVLTGPLYSVYKAITVILLAKEQREHLQKPVVPMFWIAGEDHDLEEINHTYTIADAQVKKRGYSERSRRKTMASTTKLNKEAMAQFVQTVFYDFGETAYTESLLQNVLAHLEKSETFTDFFTALMNDLFKNHGLLMIDAADPAFRAYERAYFMKIITHSETIARVVVAQEEKLAAAGYGTPIEASTHNANLFYVHDGERFLLEYKDGYFSNVLAHVKMTKDELMEVARNTPEKLSNNVVTRPLMQEMTLPVLAFVGGPGELAYWATLKDAFATLQLQMPIFAPRLNITLKTAQTDTLLVQHELSAVDVMMGGAAEHKEAFIASVQDEQATKQLVQMERTLLTQYEQLEAHLASEGLHLNKVMAKNKAYHVQQLNYVQQKIAQQVAEKHRVAIRQYDLLQAELLPNDGWQERAYNPYHYVNVYGDSLIDELLLLKLGINSHHNIISL
ncbi:MAG: bacillithiol biosynthesis cysteine-adding enzyme BshC [Solibacillus sp.]